MSRKGQIVKLAPEVNRILFIRNLPYNITSEEMYEIFGLYGAIRQIRLGNIKGTQGTAFVIFEDIYEAKAAREKLNGFSVGGRYLSLSYFQPNKLGNKTKFVSATVN
jgi:pre-mRNA branch site protein p14